MESGISLVIVGVGLLYYGNVIDLCSLMLFHEMLLWQVLDFFGSFVIRSLF